MTQLGMFDGQGPALAREGIDRVLDHAGDHWLDATTANVVRYLRTHAEFTADDVHRHELVPYPPHHPNAFGALMRRLIEHGYLERVGSMRSGRTRRKAGRNQVYRSKVYRGAVDYDR